MKTSHSMYNAEIQVLQGKHPELEKNGIVRIYHDELEIIDIDRWNKYWTKHPINENTT